MCDLSIVAFPRRVRCDFPVTVLRDSMSASCKQNRPVIDILGRPPYSSWNGHSLFISSNEVRILAKLYGTGIDTVS